ncbi:hypothetical protein POM88_025687 [Heracleum sosnowskyi]|uniref:Response regulatory domain-containing protein n=1 Tax=Heracleum sosnowskyi TaxID=360622 RepID=A0AAD8I6T1_9APIA|nr:hypothetical protein POM88_025687 [Heracleum sosnowskyi]
MYSVLLVDDDGMCLADVKTSLAKWNIYEVTTVCHAFDAMCLLEQKSFDLVMMDIHMSEINGFELLKHITEEFKTPVVLMLEEFNSNKICEGLKNGDNTFLIKPIMADDVRDMWQLCEMRKINLKMDNKIVRRSLANVPASSFTTKNSDDKSTKRTRNIVWTPRLHTQFVEALLIFGYHNAIPKNISEALNEPTITREQVGSHLQKYRKFVNRVLDGKISFKSSKYYNNRNYYSSLVGGNPDIFLINQLREERRTGKQAAPIPPSLPLSPFNKDESFSSTIVNAGPTSTNCTSFIDVASQELGNSTFPIGGNLNMGNLVWSNTTYGNHSQNLNYETNQMGHYNDNTLMQQQIYNFTNGALFGGGNVNHLFPSTNLVSSSGTSTESIHNNFIYEQPLNLGGQGNTIIFNVNNFSGVQVENGQPNQNFGTSFGTHQFTNTAVNEQACL